MSEGINKVILLGNLGADPELKGTNVPVLKLRLATTERVKDKSGEWKDVTEWHSVVVFGKRAEGLVKFLRKGDSLFVEGKLHTSNYEKNGEKRYSTDVIADRVIPTGGKPRQQSDTDRPPPMSREPGDYGEPPF